MVWKNCASQLAITLQRKVLTAAIVYAISVIAHLTSPVGHGTEIPTHSAQRTNPFELRNAILFGNTYVLRKSNRRS